MKNKIIIFDLASRSFYGAQKDNLFLAEHLRNTGSEVVYLLHSSGLQAEQIKEKKFRIKFLQAPSARLDDRAEKRSSVGRFFRNLKLVGFLKTLTSILKEEKPDLIYCIGLKSALLAATPARNCGIPKVMFTAVARSHFFWSNYALREMDLVVTNTEQNLKIYPNRLLAKHRRKVRVVPSGLDMEEVEFKSNDQGLKGSDKECKEVVVGMAGSLTPRKGIHYFLETAEKIYSIKRNVRFYLAGDAGHNGKYYEGIKKRAEALEKKGMNLKFCGYQKDIYSFLKKIDILVLTSTHEGMPRIILEAMAMAKPVAAFDVGDVSALVQAGRTGELVSFGDTERMANEVMKMIQNAKLRHEYGLSARNAVLNKYSKKQYVESIKKWMMELISGKL